MNRTGRSGDRKFRNVEYVQGSFTVEAAYLIPIAFLLFAVVFQLAMSLDHVVHQAAEDTVVLQELDSLGYFLKGVQLDGIKDLLLNGK